MVEWEDLVRGEIQGIMTHQSRARCSILPCQVTSKGKLLLINWIEFRSSIPIMWSPMQMPWWCGYCMPEGCNISCTVLLGLIPWISQLIFGLTFHGTIVSPPHIKGSNDATHFTATENIYMWSEAPQSTHDSKVKAKAFHAIQTQKILSSSSSSSSSSEPNSIIEEPSFGAWMTWWSDFDSTFALGFLLDILRGFLADFPVMRGAPPVVVRIRDAIRVFRSCNHQNPWWATPFQADHVVCPPPGQAILRYYWHGDSEHEHDHCTGHPRSCHSDEHKWVSQFMTQYWFSMYYGTFLLALLSGMVVVLAQTTTEDVVYSLVPVSFHGKLMGSKWSRTSHDGLSWIGYR